MRLARSPGPAAEALAEKLLKLAEQLAGLGNQLELTARGPEIGRQAARLCQEARRVDRAFAACLAEGEPAAAVAFRNMAVPAVLDKTQELLTQIAEGHQGRILAADVRRHARALRVAGDLRWPRWMRALELSRMTV